MHVLLKSIHTSQFLIIPHTILARSPYEAKSHFRTQQTITFIDTVILQLLNVHLYDTVLKSYRSMLS